MAAIPSSEMDDCPHPYTAIQEAAIKRQQEALERYKRWKQDNDARRVKEDQELEVQLAAFAKTKKFPMTHDEAKESIAEFVSWQNEEADRRVQFPGGMERSSSEDKIDYLLVRDGPLYERWAAHLTEGAKRHEPRNWMKASGEAECLRFRESAVRHFEAWLRGDRDEDHAAAVFFNINGAEYVWNKDFDQLEAEFYADVSG